MTLSAVQWARAWYAHDQLHKRTGRRRLALMRAGLDPRVLPVPLWQPPL